MLSDMLRALCPVARHHHADLCRVYMYPCCNEFACRVLCVGSGKWEASIYYGAAWGTNKKKRDKYNEQWIPDTGT